MIDKKQARLRRARKTRAKIAELKTVRLSVHRSNCHIYAQVISACGAKVLAAASSLEPEVRKTLPNGGDIGAAKAIGLDVLRHRVIVTYEAEAEEVQAEDVVRRVLNQVEVP